MAYKQELWDEAKKRCHIGDEEIRMAKIVAFMTALTLASGLSACEGKVPVSIDVTDATRIEETEVAVSEEPSIGRSSVLAALKKLVNEGSVNRYGSGRSTYYVKSDSQ